jgi:hypothetical protein
MVTLHELKGNDMEASSRLLREADEYIGDLEGHSRVVNAILEKLDGTSKLVRFLRLPKCNCTKKTV